MKLIKVSVKFSKTRINTDNNVFHYFLGTKYEILAHNDYKDHETHVHKIHETYEY